MFKATRLTAASVAALAVLAAACSSSSSDTGNSSGSTSPATAPSTNSGASTAPSTTGPAPSATGAAAAALSGDITFNQDNLGKLDDALKSALAGKDLSNVNIAMVVNVAADYWKAGEVGFKKGCSDLGLSSGKCTYFAPPNGKLTEQTSELETLRSQGVTGYSISAIDPKSAAGTIASDVSKGVYVLAIDSPLPGTKATLYLGTPNYQAGFAAGTAMKQVLNGKGKVAILVGSLTAANATERIQGFEDAIKGTGITVAQKVNDNLSASTATSDAETILANNPDVNGLYGVYSYDGPALAQAVVTAKKTDSVHIVSDDSDAQTLDFIKQGIISGTVVQMPYQQGYTGAYILAAEKVLGNDATMAIIKPYLEKDGTTLSSGVGLVTNSNLSDYQALEAQLGIS
jgi:ribose transport system substrate-binding protein